ncbi:MAG TPA: hypothetical protein VEF76_13400 [Patescibacteria group bacterium]|nr:hypothetical protein [Patescibacteria group bacterium]
MADNEKTAGKEFFDADKPSKLKTAFQYFGAAWATVTGDGTNYGWEATGNAYDYVKTALGAQGIGLKKKPG